uniref:Uncharacterized protein n=1 Tax=Panagrolaimus superbus TaxID=310955 RepID=A0A914Y5M9_9BILA
MGDNKRLMKKDTKKHNKKRRRHDSDRSSDEESKDSRIHRKRHKKEKKRKFRKPKRKRASSSESSSNYGDMNEILKTPPKHQKMKRIMYRRKIRNIDPDMFLSLKKFAYDKEKMVQQAFLTLRRGVIERICPPELSHLTMDELKAKVVNLACTMSKERLRTYADDDDMSHASDSYEADTPTDVSDSDLEIVDDEELVEKLFEEKAKALEHENEMREKLARKMAEKALLSRMKSKPQEQVTVAEVEKKKDKVLVKKQQNGDVEDGEIISDDESNINLSRIPLPPPSPQPITISDDEDMKSELPNLTETIILPPPPPPPLPPPTPTKSTIILEYDTHPIATSSNLNNKSVVRLVSSKADNPVISVVSDSSVSNGSTTLNLKEQLTSLEKQLLAPIESQEEIDFDDDGMGSEPEIDLCL